MLTLTTVNIGAPEPAELARFYAAPVGPVSRAQLLTGCYGARVSVPDVYSPAGSRGLNPTELTIAERLKERGHLLLDRVDHLARLRQHVLHHGPVDVAPFSAKKGTL